VKCADHPGQVGDTASPCEPAQWGERVLNEPTVRFSTCAIADAAHGARAGRRSKLIKLKAGGERPRPTAPMESGAGPPNACRRHNWRWRGRVPRLQHLHQCGRELPGRGQGTARAWPMIVFRSREPERPCDDLTIESQAASSSSRSSSRWMTC